MKKKKTTRRKNLYSIDKNSADQMLMGKKKERKEKKIQFIIYFLKINFYAFYVETVIEF